MNRLMKASHRYYPTKKAAELGWATGPAMAQGLSGQAGAVAAHQSPGAARIPARRLAGTISASSQRQLTNRP